LNRKGLALGRHTLVAQVTDDAEIAEAARTIRVWGNRLDSVNVAVITGGSSGIGAALARDLTAEGWRCVLVARGEERLRALAEELGAEAEICDVGDRAAVEALAARVTERHPRIKLLVNNAGIPARADFLAGEADRIEAVTRINYLGGVWCLRAFLPALEAAAPSDVVNVVSVAGTVTMPPSGPYSAAKHAQLAFSRATAAQLRHRGVRIHTVLPGFAETAGFPQRGVIPKPLEWTIIGPERISRSILAAVKRDRRESYVPSWYRPVAWLQAILPSLVARVLARGRYGGPGAV
jgi:NAD(P)-dependent dehydrogenase (short-subunit alcohol dehydrogenase family)